MLAAAVWTVSELLIYQYRSSQTPRLYRGTCFNNFLEKTLKQDAKKFQILSQSRAAAPSY